jgi:Fe-S-cluster-containing dehydrogenase component
MDSLSRRSFLKKGLVAAGAVGAAGMPLPAAARGKSPAELCTLIEIEKCIACGACVDACYTVNGHKMPEPEKPFPTMYPTSRVKVANWTEKRNVTDRLTPYNWLYIQHATVDVNGTPRTLHIPRRCMHCANPPCADLCPFGAARKLKNGITRIDSNLCLGGSKCKSVCPWHIPERQTGVGLYLDLLPNFAGNGVMYKCDRCYDRVARGQVPACIEVCPQKVQSIGPRDEIVARARELARKTGGHLYGLDENGGTNTIYLSPVPFSELNAAVATGPGRPDLSPKQDMMARSDMLADAMIIAPVAAAAGALLRFAGWWKKGRANGKEVSS